MSSDRVVGYTRVSTAEQAAEGVSLDAQRVRIEAYCLYRGLDLVDVVVDAGVSASIPLARRPGGARLLANAGSAAVVATKLDRLFRDAADCLVTTRAWDAADVALHVLDLGVDTSTAFGRAFLTMAAAFAELERNLIAERTADGLAQVQKDGGTLGAEGYGWRRADATDNHGRLVCVEVAAELAVVERIIVARRAGLPYAAIAAALNVDEVPTKRGGIWHASTVRNIALRARDSE